MGAILVSAQAQIPDDAVKLEFQIMDDVSISSVQTLELDIANAMHSFDEVSTLDSELFDIQNYKDPEDPDVLNNFSTINLDDMAKVRKSERKKVGITDDITANSNGVTNVSTPPLQILRVELIKTIQYNWTTRICLVLTL